MSMVISASTLMRRAYAGNTMFKDESYRKNKLNYDVVSADRKALTRALDQLETLDFESEEDDDAKQIYNTVNAYLDVYNYAVSAAMDSDSSDIQRTGKSMKALMKQYDQQLSDIGITLKSDGTVKINDTELKKATTRQISKIFGDSDYISGMRKAMKKLRNQINREGAGSVQQEEPNKTKTALSETVGTNLNLYV